MTPSIPGEHVVVNRTVEEPVFTFAPAPRSVFRRKRFLLPFGIAAATALAGVIALFASGTVTVPWQQPTLVRGVLASKRAFFEDGEVRRILMARGFQVQVTPVASRDIAGRDDLDTYDFAFPSGQAIADLIRDRRKGGHTSPYRPFFTPVVLGSYRDYAEALVKAEVAEAQQDGSGALYYDLHMEKFVALVSGELDPNSDREQFWATYGLKNGNRITAQTPDPCAAYSGEVYLGMTAFAANGNDPPHSEPAALELAARIKPLFDIEGQHGDDLGPKYLAHEGRTFAPVAVIYEHQYLAHQLAALDRTGRPDTERVLLYPAAQHESTPELLAFTPAGDRLGALIMEDPDLRRRAVELGFHVFDPSGTYENGALADHLGRRGLEVPTSGIGDTETWLPDLPLLEKMVDVVGGCR